MRNLAHYFYYALGIMLMLKGLNVEPFSKEFWFFAMGVALFSLSHDFRYALKED